MAKSFKSREKLVGQAPGTLTFIGNKKMERPRFKLMSYNEKEIIEDEQTDVKKLLFNLKDDHVN